MANSVIANCIRTKIESLICMKVISPMRIAGICLKTIFSV